MLIAERNERDPLSDMEDATVELRQAIALLKAIDEGELLAAIPADLSARKRHEAGVSLLAMVQPRLERVLLRLRLAE